MDKRILIVGAAAIVVIALFYMAISQGSSAVKAKFCSPQEPSVKLYSCGQGIYEIASLPDVGISYVDSSGNTLAQCNGFINKPNPPECAKYAAFPCNVTDNLCVKG